MKRREFLSQLKSALENKLSEKEIKKNIDYYNDYIEEEVGKGQMEEEVIAALGDPWAIAKTILISAEMGGQEYYSYSEEVSNEYESDSASNAKMYQLDSWWKIALVVLVILAIVLGIFSVVFGVLALFIRFAFPILIIVLIVRLIHKK